MHSRPTPVSLSLGVLVLLATVAPAVAQTPHWTPEQQAVIDAASQGPVGIESDFEGWAAGYHRDWSYWRLGSDTTRPREEHLRLVRDYIGEGNKVTGFELEPVDVIVEGTVALLRLNATETIEQADGATRVARYSAASLWVLEGDGWTCRATNILHLPDGD